MKIHVVVNDVEDVGPRQTTSMLTASLLRMGHQVLVSDVRHSPASPSDAPNSQATVVSAVLLNGLLDRAALADVTSETIHCCLKDHQPSRRPAEILPEDVVFLRTNPGRDLDWTAQHDALLRYAQRLETTGVCVINSPAHLKRFASKAAILELPEQWRPTMLISANPAELASFIREAPGDCVVKPLIGSRGEHVTRVSADRENLEAFLEDEYAGAEIVAQHFVVSEDPGDCRVVVVDGEILEVDGHFGGIQRVPAPGDFRANLHAGAEPRLLQLSASQRAAATAAAELLREHGIRLAGIDLIGDKVIEFNVFSTGGLYHANRFTGIDFADEVCRRLLKQTA